MGLCTAKRSNGVPCKAYAIAGATVCRTHGGSAPQVIAAARLRILAVADSAAARLVQIALGTKTKHGDAIAAIRDLLNRAEVIAQRAEGVAGADNGQVLWDEFIQIHRRRVVPAVQSEDPNVQSED